MKNLKNITIYSIVLAFCLLVTPNIHANGFGISDQKYDEINTRVNSMSFEQLNSRVNTLKNEQRSLEQSLQEGSEGSSAASSSVRQRLAEISADAGATATDLSGAVTVVTAGTVDTNTVGSYTLTYTSTDASGNGSRTNT